MGLTSLFFDMTNKNVLIVGAGSVGIRRAKRFINADSNVSIVTHSIDPEIKKVFLDNGVKFYDNSQLDNLIKECDLIVIATSDHELNKKLAKKAEGKLINCADNPDLSNIIVPSTFNIGTVIVSLYTGSKSPLMAKQLRKKIQDNITDQDILNIELQEYIRSLLKDNIDNQPERKKYMMQFVNDPYTQELLKSDNLNKAKQYVKQSIEKL